MSPGKISRIVVIAIAAIGWSAEYTIAGDQAGTEWLRGSGDDLEMRLAGRVVDADGRPAADLRVSGYIGNGYSKQTFDAAAVGDRFEVWVPLNRGLYWVSLKAATTRDDHVAYRTFNGDEVRQAAIDGLVLKLEPPTRQVQVKVHFNNEPVPDASVLADLSYFELHSTTNADGIARFSLLPTQELRGVSAWTKDYRIGGYSFDRKPVHDPDLNEYTIELSACRDQKLRFVDPDGTPAAGLDFIIQMATPPPNYNYLGGADHFPMTTDAAGEVNYRWFPVWDNHHFYADLRSRGWIRNGDHHLVDGIVLFPVKRGANRKRVTGHLTADGTSAGGFSIRVESFQGEEEGRSDHLSTFTDADGSFSVDVLPNATYCVYALDSQWVSAVVDLIPYESAADRVTSPELTVTAGQEVQVQATIGPEQRPYPHLGVYVQRPYHYTWQEQGESRSGSGGPRWWTKTDESGRVTVRTLPGELEVSTYTPFWRTEEKIKVEAGKPATVTLNRAVEKPRSVSGHIQLADGLDGELQNAQITAGSIDGATSDDRPLTAAADGSFSFETRGTAVAVFARTSDGRYAGLAVAKNLDAPIEVLLRPTGDFRGQLLGEGDRPVIGHSVWASVRVGEEYSRTPVPKSIEGLQLEAKTDDQGNYTFAGLPCETKVFVWTNTPDESKENRSLGDVYLVPGESRPVAVNRLADRPERTEKASLSDRYQQTLRDCALCGFRLMLILPSDGEEVDAFVGRHLLDGDENPAVPGFMQLVETTAQNKKDPAAASFLAARNWQRPAERHVVAYAIDVNGDELGRIDLDVSDPSAAAAAEEFVRQHSPAPVDAEKKWNAAFAEAERTNRRVWARVSERYCGPCFAFARWLDDQHTFIEKDFVLLKIDDVRDVHGEQVAERLTRGERQGVPFHAIFDSSGKLLIDSAGPLGNIGAVGGFEGKKHLRKMLLETRRSLTDAEVEQVVESVGN